VTKRPKKLRVGGRTYTVSWIPDSEWVAAGLDEDTAGLCLIVHGQILMRIRGDEYQLRENLLHEIVHAAFEDAKSSYYIERAKDPEEFVTHTLSPRLLQIMTANPKVRAYLFGE